MTTTPSGPWERRPRPPAHSADRAEEGSEVTAVSRVPRPTGDPPQLQPPPPPAQVPFFPGMEDATALIQRITDEAAPPQPGAASLVEETIRIADRPLAPRRGHPAPAADFHRPLHQEPHPADASTPDHSGPPSPVVLPGPDPTLDPEADPSAATTVISAGGSAAPSRTAQTSGVMRAGALMAVATLASRITGFIAKTVLLAVLGLFVVNDSYIVANTLPNIVFELVIGGVLTSVAIPLLSRARSDPDGGQLYTQKLMTVAIVGLLVITLFAVLAAPVFTAIYVSGPSKADPVLTNDLARLLLPQIFFYGIAAVFGAILNTKERFAAPAWAPVVNNLVVIVVALIVARLPGGILDPGGRGLTGLSSTQLWVLGLGTTAGIVVQALVMLPALLRSGFRFRWRWGGDPRLKDAGRLMLWSIGYAVISAVSFAVSTRVFTATISGGVSAFSYASLLFQLPYGIIGVSVLTAIMPRMSRHAADGDIVAVKNDASVANRLSTIALMPMAAAMFALAAPLALIVNRGEPGASSQLLGTTLAGMALGLVPLAVTLVQMRVFYAMKDARTPTLINLAMVAVRVPLVLLCGAVLPTELVVPGVAFATTLSYVVGAVVGEIWLRSRFGPMGTTRLLTTVMKTTVTAGTAGLAAWWVARQVAPTGSGIGGAALQLGVGVVTGLLVLVPTTLLVGLPEVQPVRRRIAALLGFGDTARADTAADPAPSTTSGTNAVMTPGPAAAGGLAPSGGHPIPPLPSVLPPPAARTPALRPPARKESVMSADDPTPDLPAEESAREMPTDEPGEPPVDQQAASPSEPSPAGPAAPQVDPSGPTVPTSDAEQTLAVTPGRAVRHAAADVPELAPGATVGGRYRLTGQVAIDAAGNRFWRARDTVLPRDMAVTLMPDSSGTSATVARTLRAGRLHHIGLPQTLDLGTDHGQTFVVGQWVDGATLTDLLAKGPLEPGVATAIAGKISEAVAEAHRNGLSLGSINPSLIRVNVDGQARFSHVIAHATATADNDIRAVGALLYLMLTATWPSGEHVPMVPGADLRPAPQRSGRELSADLVVDGVPAALAQLTDRALHPEDPGGIHAVGALATLLRAPDVTPAPAPGALPGATVAAAPEQPPPTMSPADRKLRQERRVKIGVAATFIAAFVALILIVVGTLAKNTLSSIAENNQIALAPPAETSRVAPTTASAAAPTVPSPTTSVSSTSTSTSVSPSSASSSPAPDPQPVTVVGAEVYDPEGRDQSKKDYSDLVDRLYDGDPSNGWQTDSYKQQFKPQAEGGYKVGVGVVLQFDTPVAVNSVDITPGPGTEQGMTIEIRAVSSLEPGPLDQTQLLATAQVGGPTIIEPPDAPKSSFLLVFITQAPGSPGKWQAKIGEISVKGTP